MRKNGLTKEQKALLTLACLASDEKEENELKESFLCDFDWEKIIKYSINQAVCVLTFKNAEKYKDIIPKEAYKKWADAAFNNISSNLNVVQAQYKLTSLLEENKIEYVILKGLSSSSYYDYPSYRSFGDIDFLVDEKHREKVKELLLNNGYKKGIDEVEHHSIFRKYSVVFELHNEISGIPNNANGAKIRDFIKDMLEERVYTEIKSDMIDCGFYSLKNVFHGAILIIHMQHHMTFEGLGLRHLLDWAYFVNKTVNDSFWEDKLLPFLKDIGLYYYTKVITKTCSIYLKSKRPKWCKDVSEDICKDVIEDVLKLGNFGLNNSESSKSGIMVSDSGKGVLKKGSIKYLFKAFHNLVKARHPVVVKCKILYPVFYIIEFIRYIFGLIFGKRTSVSKMVKESKSRKTLYKKLRLFENGAEKGEK